MGHFRNNEPSLEDKSEIAEKMFDNMDNEEIIDKYFPIYEEEIIKEFRDCFIDHIESEL